LDVPVQAGRRIAEANPRGHILREAMARPSGHKVGGPMLPRKASSEPMRKPYPNKYKDRKENITIIRNREETKSKKRKNINNYI
jgi:hypothetical protein